MTRVLVLTDSDSYVKWGAALAGRVPPSWHVRFAIARGSAEPSARQVAEAVAGTVIEPDTIERVGLEDVRTILQTWRPDVLVTAARGLAVQTVVELAVDNRPDRPVIVSGLPGIALPVLPYGLGFRRSVDLFVLHSHREVRAFAEASRALDIPHRYALARLPFLPDCAHPSAQGPASLPRSRIVFAAQALVPETREDRVRMRDALVRTARAHPELEVVVKVRGTVDEPQTHADQHPYPALLAEIDVPPNLVVESGPMAGHLERAVGLVTVSSTALLEAVASGVPALALTDFGVEARQINLVFEDSGLLHDSSELVAGRFHHPDPAWQADNYFHDPADDTWLTELAALLEQREREGLAPYPTAPDGLRKRVTMLFYRHQAFAGDSGPVMRVVERGVVAIALRVSRSSWVVSRRFKPARTAPMGDSGPAETGPADRGAGPSVSSSRS
ncbi:DUF6716 putative glycosyltransferase [Aeromicrobium sp. Leaf350]|uniref:DUF6716 putative glycosyltransferase n=1 Tax=Aeromicrobium sp. Leaf350 TaxID=2876565 RepID=UPI001E315871|nr:DUF6716 putative glycosyltransferase [Aeromicrobium sp. Leaf350]